MQAPKDQGNQCMTPPNRQYAELYSQCQEQWPSCANCIKRGCPCRYPTVFKQTQHDRIVSEVMKSPRPLVRLNDTPTMYSANDMRLFHHFLVAAHPCIPHEYESVWVRDVPAFSHQVRTFKLHR